MANYEFVSEAVVTLSVRDSDHSDIPERCVRLDRSQNTSSVGRASKVEAKGFVAAADNAWFNSPVMSRAHGELVADLDKKVVCIRDIGSLHGTFINGEVNRIAPNALREIYDGDEIAFGVALLRNGESFDPMKVRVGIEFENGDAPSARCSTFAVPEGSDVEEDYSSDDEKEHNRSGAMVKLLHDLMPTRATTGSGPPHGDTIDLTDHDVNDFRETFNDPVKRTVAQIIDLTSPGALDSTVDAEEHASGLIMPLSKEDRDILYSDSQSNSSDLASSLLDEDEEEDDDISDDDGTSDDDGISDSDMSGIDDDPRVYSGEFDPYDTDLDDGLQDDLNLDGDYTSDDDMVDPDDPETVSWDLPVPDATVAKEAERNAAEGDVADKIPTQAAPATEEATPATKEAPAEAVPAAEEAAPEEIPAKEPATLPPKDDLRLCAWVNRGYITIDDGKSDALTPVEPEAESPTIYHGAGARPTIPSILNPVLSPDGPAASSRPNTIFGAQEEHSSDLFPPSGSCSEPTSANTGANCIEPTPRVIAPVSAPDKARNSPAYRQTVAMFPLLEAGDAFLNSPESFCGSFLAAQRFAGVAPGEETSAYDLQQMKLAEEARQRDLGQDRTRRTHVGIADIVDNCPQQPDGVAATDPNDKSQGPRITFVDRDGSSKRKSDHISDLSSADVDWEKVTASLASHDSYEPPARYSAAAMSGTSRGTLSGPPSQPWRKIALRRQGVRGIPSNVQPEPLEEARPAKRMRLRHIAEKIGYAALGGATVGAAIMTTLIYTAPSFA